MYFNHFGLNEPPFRITPHTDFFFSGANRGATLDALLYAIVHDEGIVKVSGEVGSGKTMLCRVLMERLPQSVETIYLANPSLSRDEILHAIADELGINVDSAGRTTRLLRGLQDHLIKRFAEGRRVVVLIDEAHAMPNDSLEEIRLLSNLESDRHKLLQIVLFGQPELDTQLSTLAMRQLKERITHGFRLEPMIRSDIESYIDFRMRAAGYRGPNVFTPGAIRVLAKASAGLTRRVNILADKSMLAAFAVNAHAVTEREVRRAIRDSEFYRPIHRVPLAWLLAGALAAGLGIGFGGHLYFAAENAVVTTPQAAPATAPSRAATDTQSPTAVPAQSPPPGSDAPSGSSPSETAANPALAARSPAMPASAHAPNANSTADVARTLRESGSPDLPGSADIPPDAHPTPPAHGRITQERFAETQKWLKAAAGNYYALQLFTANANETARIEDFLRRASSMLSAADFHVYSVKINGSQHYRVAYGSYPNMAASMTALRNLPALLRTQTPFPRSVDRMRSQNRQ